MDLKHPPEFSGSDFAKYKRSIQMWVKATDVPKEKHGILTAMRCIGPALDFIDSLEMEKIENENGVTYLLEQFESEFAKNQIDDIFDKYAALFSLRRTGSLTEYSQEFKKRVREFTKLTKEVESTPSKVQIPDYLLAMQYLLGANLNHSEHSLIKTVLMTKSRVEEYKLDSVISIATDLLSSRVQDSLSQPTLPKHSTFTEGNEAFALSKKGKGKGKRGKSYNYKPHYHRDEYSRPYGNSQSYSDRSYPQFMQMPDRHNYRSKSRYRSASHSQHRGEFSRPTSDKRNKGKGKHSGKSYKPYVHFADTPSDAPQSEAQFASSFVFAANSNPTLDNSALVSSAILDTACSKCLCSMEWIDRFEDYLQSIDEPREIEWECQSDSFSFADDKNMTTRYVAYLPVRIGDYTDRVKVAVLENTSTPLLMSYSAMQSLGFNLNTGKNTLSSDVCNLSSLPLNRTSSGHPILPLFVPSSQPDKSFDPSMSFSSDQNDNQNTACNGTCEVLVSKEQDLRASFSPNSDSKDISHTYVASRFTGSEADVMKLHKQFGHASSNKLRTMLFRNAKFNPKHVANIEKVLSKCEVCRKCPAPPKRPKIGGWQSVRLNQLVFLDLFYLRDEGKTHLVAHLIDSFSKFSHCEIIPDKTANSVRRVIISWACKTGNYPEEIFCDNGGEFCNRIIYDLCSSYDIMFNTTAPAHAWQNGVNETRTVFKKIRMDFAPEDQPEPREILNDTVRALNSLPVTNTGYSPFFLAFLVQPKFMTFNDNPSPSEAQSPDVFNRHVKNQLIMQERIRQLVVELTSKDKVNEALRKRQNTHSYPVQQGDIVYYYKNGSYHGPFRCIGRDGKLVFIRKGNQVVKTTDYEVMISDEYLMPNEQVFGDSNDLTVQQIEPQQGIPATEASPSFGQSFRDSNFEKSLDTDFTLSSINHRSEHISPAETDAFSPIPQTTDIDILTPDQFYERQQVDLRESSPHSIRHMVLRDEFTRPKDYMKASLPEHNFDTNMQEPLKSQKRHEPKSVIFESPDHKKLRSESSEPIVPSKPVGTACKREEPSSLNLSEPELKKARTKPQTYLEQTQEAVHSQHDIENCPDCDREVNTSMLDIHQELFCPGQKSALKIDVTHQDVTKQDLIDYRTEFDQAIFKEYNSFKCNGVFEEFEISKNQLESYNIVNSRWVLSWKRDDSGNRIAKARLVLKGYQDKQKEWLVVDSPTVSKNAVRILLQYCANVKCKPHLVDLKTAFLQGDPYKTEDHREVYCYPPPELTTESSNSDKLVVWKMVKSAYGLCDAPRVWYQRLSKALLKYGLRQCKYDDCVFVYSNNDVTEGLLAIHVDDLIFGGSQRFIDTLIHNLSQEFDIGNHQVGNFTFCGSRIESHSECITLDQNAYLRSLEPIKTESRDHARELTGNEYSQFRTLLGNLSWLSINSRPDIAFEVNRISMVQNQPTIGDLKALNRVLRDALSRPHSKLRFPASTTRQTSLILMSDAAFGNCPDLVSSQGGHFVFYGEKPSLGNCTNLSIIDWSSKKLRRIAKSTFVAEMLAFSKGIDHAIYLRNLIHDMTGKLLHIHGFTDSNNFLQLLHNSKCPEDKRSRIDLAYLRETLREGEVQTIEYVDTHTNLADILTKKNGTALSFFRDFMDSNRYELNGKTVEVALMVSNEKVSLRPNPTSSKRRNISSVGKPDIGTSHSLEPVRCTAREHPQFANRKRRPQTPNLDPTKFYSERYVHDPQYVEEINSGMGHHRAKQRAHERERAITHKIEQRIDSIRNPTVPCVLTPVSPPQADVQLVSDSNTSDNADDSDYLFSNRRKAKRARKARQLNREKGKFVIQ